MNDLSKEFPQLFNIQKTLNLQGPKNKAVIMEINGYQTCYDICFFLNSYRNVISSPVTLCCLSPKKR